MNSRGQYWCYESCTEFETTKPTYYSSTKDAWNTKDGKSQAIRDREKVNASKEKRREKSEINNSSRAANEL